MGKVIQQTITDFSKGMTNDARNPDTAYAQLIEHFDIFTAPHRLAPFRSYENGDSSSATNKIANFAWLGAVLYGLGVKPATGGADVWSVNNFTTPTWTEVFPSVTGSARTVNDLPFFSGYKGALYGARGGRFVWSFTILSSSMNPSEFDLTAYTTVSNGIVHSKDDILYVGYDNKIAKNNAGSWTGPALTLPTNCYITSICEYGNYLAIGTASNDVDAQSTVYLWDRDSSLTTLSEKIDWGPGTLKVLEQVDGALVGISQENSANYFNSRIVLRVLISSAAGATRIAQVSASSANASLTGFKQKFNNRVLFGGVATLGGTAHAGVWSVSRSNSASQFALVFERLSANDTTTVTNPLGFIIVGDYFFHAYIDNGAAYNMVKTDDQANYTATSLYESQVFNAGEARLKKDLIGVTVSTEPLPGSGQIVLKYKKDADTSWSSAILTLTTDDAISGSTLTSLPKDWKELQLRIESTGGAVVTGLSYKAEITGKDIYD